MSKKIGEALLEKGLLGRAQLNHGLKSQLIFGGTLGTCLIELGYVEEQTLARTLCEILGMKCARDEMFDDIPEMILRKVSTEEVRRRRVIPIGVQEKNLHLAVIHPDSTAGMSTTSGYRIVPYLAPEVRILRAMENYYGIPRRRRYVSVPYSSIGPIGADPVMVDMEPRTATSHPATRAATEDAEEPQGPQTPRLGEVSRMMSRVNDHSELGEVILQFATERMQRCILFDVNDDAAEVANWRGFDLGSAEDEGVSLRLEPDSIFSLALEGSCYHGELPRDIDTDGFYECLGIEVPRHILVLPIYGDERLEAVLYGDGGPSGEVRGPLESYLLLLGEVDLALKMLAYKRQLCPD